MVLLDDDIVVRRSLRVLGELPLRNGAPIVDPDDAEAWEASWRFVLAHARPARARSAGGARATTNHTHYNTLQN